MYLSKIVRRFHHWLIEKVVGNQGVIMNVEFVTLFVAELLKWLAETDQDILVTRCTFDGGALGAIYHVDPANGSDANSGLCPDAAFCTVAHATEQAGKGDVILVRQLDDVYEEILVI